MSEPSRNAKSKTMMLRKAASCLASLLAAYLVCAISGANLWMYVWLKDLYLTWMVSLWVALAMLLVVLSMRPYKSRLSWLLTGAAAGYLAGAIVYQLVPALQHGSLRGTAATVAAYGISSYIFVSMFFPLLTLSWLPGVVTAAVFASVTRRSDNDVRIAGYLVGAVVIVGWAFFLSHQGVPLRW